IVGGFSVVFEEVIIIGTMLSVLLHTGLTDDDARAGSIALMLWSASGAMLMAGAGNLLTIFLGLELLSLALYCLCGIPRLAGARESALKYLILSSMASGFLLYGMALLFGASGSVALSSLLLVPVASKGLFVVGTALFLMGMAFKLSLAPFHVWAPDVYQGAPLAVTAFMSVVTKAGALAVLGRFAYSAVPANLQVHILLPVWVLAGLSMIVGNVAALAQTDIKRLLAYSGIAQIGYIVAAFAGTSALGLRYAIFYFVAYTFMNLGAFSVVALLSSQTEEGSNLAAFSGLGQRRPVLAAAMTFFLLALAGLPPTAGFVGKILILSSSVGAGYVWLAGLLILGTAISLYAYFKIIGAMYERSSRAQLTERRLRSPLAWLSVLLCAAAVLAMAFYPLTPSNVLPIVK
ncbi:MAG: NADH-quinone oxidoreductase subunit N, partial [Candidatus Eremiobacteraeota bacterium]|nr:NADH-quinone oxidoreductase subunit N [Candidatus Eremiobacteraeota bacterium]